jgi:YggT family protein
VRAVWSVLEFVTFIFLILLIGRFVLELVQGFARDWRPRGLVLVLAEVVYTITDPALRVIRRIIPPIRLGGISLDLGLMVLFILTTVLLSVFSALARQA